MGELVERHEVSRLLGAPLGYAGHESGGQLTAALRARPASVVLLEDAARAHPDVLGVFTQAFDAGKLTDGRGTSVDARHATFVLTVPLEERDVAARAGVPFTVGRAADGRCGPMTLTFEIDGLAPSFAQRSNVDLYDQLRAAVGKATLDQTLPTGQVNYAPWLVRVPRSGAAVVQTTHAYDVDPLDPAFLTRATIDARKQAHAITHALRGVAGPGEIRITQTAPAIGVREARYILGDHLLDLDDLRGGRRFDDAVAFGTFNLNVDDLTRGGTIRTAHCTPILPYEMPYRCLLPKDVEGLLVAGRCISGTHEAHASYRVTGTCSGPAKRRAWLQHCAPPTTVRRASSTARVFAKS